MEYTLDNIEEAFNLLDDADYIELTLKANDNVYELQVLFYREYLGYRVFVQYGTNELDIKSRSQDGVIAMVKHFVEQEF